MSADAGQGRICLPLLALSVRPGLSFETCCRIRDAFTPDELILPLNVGHAFSVLGFRTRRPAIPLPADPFLCLTGSVLTAGYLYHFANYGPDVPPEVDMCVKARNDSEEEVHFYAELWGFGGA